MRWLLLVSLAAGCDVHLCGELPVGACREKVEGEVKYARCSEELPYCAIDSAGKGVCSEKKRVIGLPGNTCQEDVHCLSRHCIGGECSGAEVDSPCGSVFDCGIGLRCRDRKCVPLLPSGATGCVSPLDCDAHSMCLEGVCARFFSREFGEKTECSNRKQSVLCKSGVCDEGVCGSRPDVLSSYPAACESDSDCASSDCAFSPSPACVCGISSTPSKHCQLRLSDDLASEYFALLQNWLLGPEVAHCHATAKFTLACVERHWNAQSAQRLKYLAQIMTQEPLQTIDPCVVEVVLNSSHAVFSLV